MMGKLYGIPIALASLLAAPQAHAQTLTATEAGDGANKGQAIATFYYSKSTRGFDADGDSIDIADYEKVELYLLAEYEVAPDLTLIFKPSFRNVSVEGGDDDSGLGYTDIGGRYRFAESTDGWLAVEATARIPGVSRDDNLAQVGSTDAETISACAAFTIFPSARTAALSTARRAIACAMAIRPTSSMPM